MWTSTRSPVAGGRSPRRPLRVRARRRAAPSGARSGLYGRRSRRRRPPHRSSGRRYRLRPDDLTVDDVREAEEAGDVLVERLRPELVRRRDLDDAPGAHDRDPVAERERLRLIVRHVDGRERELVEQASRDRRAGGRVGADRASRAARRGEGGAARARARVRARRAAALRPRASRPSGRSKPASPTRSRSSAVRAATASGGSPRMRRPNATLPETSRCGKSA